MKYVLAALLSTLFVFSAAIESVRADYVLPYPSFFPGNKLYKISRFIDSAKSWWYWGSISQTKYHLLLADKYLIEAKTLLEYKQYPLGLDALFRSDQDFLPLPEILEQVKREGKDNMNLTALVQEASLAHVVVLQKLAEDLPADFTWRDEHKAVKNLEIGRALADSIAIRSRVLSSIVTPTLQ